MSHVFNANTCCNQGGHATQKIRMTLNHTRDCLNAFWDWSWENKMKIRKIRHSFCSKHVFNIFLPIFFRFFFFGNRDFCFRYALISCSFPWSNSGRQQMLLCIFFSGCSMCMLRTQSHGQQNKINGRCKLLARFQLTASKLVASTTKAPP